MREYLVTAEATRGFFVEWVVELEEIREPVTVVEWQTVKARLLKQRIERREAMADERREAMAILEAVPFVEAVASRPYPVPVQYM